MTRTDLKAAIRDRKKDIAEAIAANDAKKTARLRRQVKFLKRRTRQTAAIDAAKAVEAAKAAKAAAESPAAAPAEEAPAETEAS